MYGARLTRASTNSIDQMRQPNHVRARSLATREGAALLLRRATQTDDGYELELSLNLVRGPRVGGA